MKKASLLAVLLVLTAMSFTALTIMPGNVRATTLYVGGGGPGNYTTIQAAINDSSPGDRIYVYNGTYYENLIVNKTLSLIGESRNSTIIDGNGTGHVVRLTSNWVNITGFTVTNSGSNWDHAGIELDSVQNCYILNNTVSNNSFGIDLYGASNNIIANNIASSNSASGIHLFTIDINVITNNIVSDNWLGIYLESTSNTIITNNSVSNNWHGILLEYSSNNTIENNSAFSNNQVGIFLLRSENNNVASNIVSNNSDGMDIFSSSNNTIVNNTVSNIFYSLYLQSSNSNRIYHNSFISNAEGAYDDTDTNQWDNGYPSGGNYWDDYTGIDEKSGPNQDQPGSDGMGDTAYYIDEDSLDRYPLVAPRNDFCIPRILEVLINGKTSQTYSIENIPELNLTAVIDDRETGNSWIGGANYTIGPLNWSSSNWMSAEDGAFDSSQEGVFAVLFQPSEVGTYFYCVYAWDVQSNFNNTSTACAELSILPSPSNPLMTSAILSGSNLRDVIIFWNRSGDDGAGENDIVRYDIYRSTNYSGLYELVGNVSADGSLTYEWTCMGCGKGDPYNYFFYVEANDTVLSSLSPNRAGKFTRTLSIGSNLVSIPLIQSNESIEAILQTVRFDKAWTYDSSSGKWKWYMSFKPYKGDLKTIRHTMGVWVNVTSNSYLTVAGLVPQRTSIRLSAGWNLVGFPSFNSTYTVSDLNSTVNSTRVEGVDSSLPPHYLRVLEDTEVLQAGYGYWISVAVDTFWTIDIK